MGNPKRKQMPEGSAGFPQKIKGVRKDACRSAIYNLKSEICNLQSDFYNLTSDFCNLARIYSSFSIPLCATPILSLVEFFTMYIIPSACRITSCAVRASCG